MPDPTGCSPLILVVILTPKPGARDRYVEYESKAAAIMARYGGVIERMIGELPAGAGGGGPNREVHLVSFPSAEAFDSYRNDPDLGAMAMERSEGIEHTQIIAGHDQTPYSMRGILKE